jgi:hypothetical protein
VILHQKRRDDHQHNALVGRYAEHAAPDCATRLAQIITDDLVTHETQYFTDPFQAPARRAALAEPIPGRDR